MQIAKKKTYISAAIALCFAKCVYAVPPPNPTASDASYNTAGGSYSQTSLTTGVGNTSFGIDTLYQNTTGTQNTAFGSFALSNSVSNNNTAIGANSLTNDSTGEYNTGVGSNSLMNMSIGDGNVAVGGGALMYFSGGNSNTAIGKYSLQNLHTGSGNIAIGQNSGTGISFNESNNIYIGNVGDYADNRTLRIGPLSGTTTLQKSFIGGISGTTLAGGGSTVLINSSGQLGTVVSSARFKKDVVDMGDESSKLMSLRPVIFHYKSDPSQTKQYGLIAEEVAKVFPDLVVRSGDGDVESVQYHELAPILLNELKKQRAELASFKEQHAHDLAEMATLKESLLTQQAILVNLQQKVDAPSRTAAR